MEITAFKKEFDGVLKESLDFYIKDLRRFTKDKFVLDVAQYPRDLMMVGGKRIRPYISYLMYKVAGGKKDKEFLKFIVGLEVFHMFALVHDDIIDRAYEQRGKLTAHKYVVTKLKKESRRGDHGHMANGLAMLVGDLLYLWSADIMMNTSGFEDEALKKVRNLYREMSMSAIIGEMIEVDITTRRRVEEKVVMDKMLLKTGEYSFVTPLLTGLALGNSNSVVYEKFCRDFGSALGTAFQIQDDYLDLTGTAEALKKAVFTDLRESVHTVFTCYIFEHGKAEDKAELDALMGSAVNDSDDARVRRLFERTGSFDYGRKLMNKYFKKTQKVISDSTLPPKHKLELKELVEYIETRNG